MIRTLFVVTIFIAVEVDLKKNQFTSTIIDFLCIDIQANKENHRQCDPIITARLKVERMSYFVMHYIYIVSCILSKLNENAFDYVLSSMPLMLSIKFKCSDFTI